MQAKVTTIIEEAERYLFKRLHFYVIHFCQDKKRTKKQLVKSERMKKLIN